MKAFGRLAALACGVGLGAAGAVVYTGSPRPAGAAGNDRYQDTIMATGAVSINPRVQSDGVWLLDYKAGKLLGTVIDRTAGKIVGWAEVDLRGEFNLVAQQDVHFLMTTGWVTQGQSALYLAETSTGQFGVYTMGPATTGSGVVIRRHDLSSFRPKDNPPPAPQPPGAVPPVAAPAGVPGLPKP